MSDTRIHICIVNTPEGAKHYLTVLPMDLVFRKGLIPEAIVGVLLRPLAAAESITPEVFARNSVFVKFMHEVIAKYAPLEPGCQEEAKRQRTGWIYIVDGRTKTPTGAVPPEDIIGAFQVDQGKIVPDSYQASPQHMLLSEDGFFQLAIGLHEQMLRKLQSRINAA